jgi:hypothetical protein
VSADWLVWRLPAALRARATAATAGPDGSETAPRIILARAFALDASAADFVLREAERAGDLGAVADDPAVARLFARHAPDVLAALLLEHHRPFDARPRGRAGSSLRWLAVLGPDDVQARPLAVWRSVAAGVRRGQSDNDRLRAADQGFTLPPPVDEPSGDDPMEALWHALTLAVTAEHAGTLRSAGAARRLREIARERPEAWADTLPWLLKAGPHAEPHAKAITLELWPTSPAVRTALEAASSHDDHGVRLAADGLKDAVGADGPVGAVALADLAARALDRHVFDAPTRLGAPGSTWLADVGLEEALRSGVRAAVAAAGRHFTSMPETEEEGHVGFLLGTLTARLAAHLPAAAAAASGGRGPQLTVATRTNGKAEETGSGADLALTVAIDLAGALRTEFAEAVQVKKSTRLHADPDRDTWTVANDQLEALLDRSASAVYWLLANDGGVLVVPAKLLVAIARGTGREIQGTFQVGYADVRHAAVDLAQFFVDLLVGAWLGSDRPGLLAYAAAGGSASAPYAVLEIDVTSAPQ